MRNDIELIERCRALYRATRENEEYAQLSIVLRDCEGGKVVDARLGEVSSMDGWDFFAGRWIDGSSPPATVSEALEVLLRVLSREARERAARIEEALR